MEAIKKAIIARLSSLLYDICLKSIIVEISKIA